jgi:hypothetical protein
MKRVKTFRFIRITLPSPTLGHNYLMRALQIYKLRTMPRNLSRYVSIEYHHRINYTDVRMTGIGAREL